MPDPTPAEFRETIRQREQQRDEMRGQRDAARAAKETVVAEVLTERQRTRDLAGEVEALTAEVARLKAGQPTGTPPTAEVTRFGVNVEENNEYNGQAPWVNAFRSAAPWGDPAEPTRRELPQPRVNADGYPLADAGTFFRCRPGVYPARFKFSMKGSGNPRFWGGGGARLAVDGTLTIDPTKDENLHFSLTGVNPADPPRDLKLICDGEDPARTFRRPFLDLVKRFACARFMDWGKIQTTTVVKWSDRVRPEEFCQTSPRGVAYELMADLCNEAGVDGWVCVPDQADDHFNRQMARLFATRLKGGRTLYIADSNERWNTAEQFPQGKRYIAAAAVHPDLTAPASDPTARLGQYLGWRDVRLAKLWREVWGDDRRLKVISEIHSGTFYVADHLLKYVAAKFGPPASFIHAMAGTYYFDLIPEFEAAKQADGTYKQIHRFQPAEIVAHLAERTKETWTKGIGRFRDLAATHGLRYYAYEGGDHVNDRSELLGRTANSEAKAAAHQHPGMAAFTAGWVRGAARQFGPGAMVMYYTGTGKRWGIVPTLADTAHPKLGAMMEAMAAAARNPPG